MKNFTSVLTYFEQENLILIFSILLTNQKCLSIFSNIIHSFWAYFYKFNFWKFLQVFWLILYVKKLILRFAIFWMNQKILRNFWKIPFLKKNSKCFESFWEMFWKKLNFEKFTSVLTHFVWGKNVWMIKIDVWKSFFPRLKIIFPTSENHFSPY